MNSEIELEIESSFNLSDNDSDHSQSKNPTSSKLKSPFEDFPEIEKKKINFREYQKEIYNNAKDKNGIIFLETGTGKTFISLMLSCYYLHKTNRTKKIAFLANTVQLVRQQYLVIVRDMNDLHEQMKWDFEEYDGNKNKIIIKELYSQLDQDEYNRKEWFNKFYKNTNILILTPQIFLNNLRRGYFALKEYSMIVLDECHHTNEDHPYNNIMKEFYFDIKNNQKIVEKQLPYIIGMTASPLLQMSRLDLDNIECSLIQLCKNLDASFIKFDRRNLEKFIETPKCKILTYEETLKKEEEHLSKFENNLNMHDIKNLFFKIKQTEKTKFIQDAFFRFNDIIKKEGHAKSTKLNSIINELQRFLSVLSIRILFELGYSSYVAFFANCLNLLSDKTEKKEREAKYELKFSDPEDQAIFQAIQTIMKEIGSKLIKVENHSHEAISVFLQNLFQKQSEFSNKLTIFLQLLEKKYVKHKTNKNGEDLQILVFVERRYVVYHLQQLIDSYYKFQTRFQFKSGHILGFSQSDAFSKKYQDIVTESNSLSVSIQEQEKKAIDYYKDNDYIPQLLPACFQQSNKFSHISVNLTHQLKTIEDFKKKTLNILIATSVAEEGFDMPECNLVISFNEIKSLQTFIQVRGRARKKDSKFIIMIPEHMKQGMKDRLDQFYSAIEIMKETAEEMSHYDSVLEYEKKFEKYNPSKIRPKIFKEEFYKKIKIKHSFADEKGEYRESLLNTNWAKTVLSDYCNSLRRVIKARYESKGQSKEVTNDEGDIKGGSLSINFRPIYVIHHTQAIGCFCTIIMPLNSNTRVFVSRGDMVKTADLAKKHAAYELVKHLYRNDKAFYPDLRPNVRSFKIEDDNDVEELIKNEEKKVELEDLRIKSKINKLNLFKRKVDNLRYYYYLTNEIFRPNFLLSPNEMPRYYFYLLEFYDEKNRIIGKKADYQLGFLYFGEAFRLEIGNGRILEDSTLKIKMVIKYLTRSLDVPEEIFLQIKKIDAFLWSAINNNDLNFFNIMTKENVDPKGFFYGFIKKKLEKTKYIPYDFDFSEEYLMLLLLDKNETCLLAANKYKEILEYIDNMSENYIFFNSLKKKIDNKEVFQKMNLNLTFLNSFKNNPTKNEELIVQNITNFRKFQIKNFITIQESVDLQIDTAEALKTQKNKKNLEKNYNYKIQNDDYRLKVFGMTKCIENYMKTEIQEEEAKYDLKQESLNSNLSFLSEFVEFPLKFSIMLQLNILNKPFMSYLRDFIKTVKFKKKLQKMLQAKNPLIGVMETNEDSNITIQKEFGYKLNIPENEVLSRIDSLEKHLKTSHNFIITQPKLANLKRFAPLKNKYNPKISTNSLDFIKIQNNQKKSKNSMDYSTNFKGFELELMLLRSALMSRKYNIMNNYERLEFFGDTILKALSTIQVFCENENQMERILHIERNKYVSNNFLCSKSCINHFFKYVLNENFRFIPPSFILKDVNHILYNPKKHENIIEEEPVKIVQKKIEETKEEKQKQKEDNKKKREEVPENFSQMSNKSLADLVESLTAVVYESNQREISFCQYFLYSLDILKKPVYNLTITSSTQTSLPPNGLLLRFVKFQEIIGYKFHYPGLLIQAFTHLKFREVVEEMILPERLKIPKNFPQKSIIDLEINNYEENPKLELLNNINTANFSYERLEFLGDAILDFFVNEYLFYETEVDSPGDLTLMKQSVVNNMSLSLMALHYDFDELILYGIESFYDSEEGKSLLNIKKNWQEYYENIDKYYELKNESLKVLGDLFEAFVGALFIDTNFDFNITRSIIRNMIYEKFIKVFASEEYVNKLPEKKLKDILERKGIKGATIKKKESKFELQDNGETLFLFVLYDHENKELHSVYAKNMKNAENKFARIFTGEQY